jgi:Na+/H+ antiporter NhaA
MITYPAAVAKQAATVILGAVVIVAIYYFSPRPVRWLLATIIAAMTVIVSYRIATGDMALRDVVGSFLWP